MPNVQARYDQHRAMAALVVLDEHADTNYAAPLLQPHGLWETWAADRMDLEDNVTCVRDILNAVQG